LWWATQQYHGNADEALFLSGFADIFSLLHILLQEALVLAEFPQSRAKKSIPFE
jgi:hypothetical protein